MQLHPDWLVPDWPAPAHVHAVFTTRAGGVSQPPFDSLNLGRPSDDAPDAVEANRRRLRAALGVAPTYLSQVHGVETVVLRQASEGAGPAIVADACVSSTRGVVCSVRAADCLPVLLTDSSGTVVAAAHAGWRGLAAGVIENNFRAFENLALDPAETSRSMPLAKRTIAWLGPCIGPSAFEVGPEVRQAFVEHDAAAESHFAVAPGGKWMADLAGLARQRLCALGIDAVYGNDSSAGWCTVNNPLLFFSYRRDQRSLGGSGRMAACIWIA